jgi:hypothetical protein
MPPHFGGTRPTIEATEYREGRNRVYLLRTKNPRIASFVRFELLLFSVSCLESER